MNTGDFEVVSKPRFPTEWQMEKQGVPPTEFTLADILKMRGYTTSIVGKWHLGHSKHQVPNDRVYDGVNLLPFVNGQDAGSPHEAFYWRADHIHGMRKGNWKYIMSTRDSWIELYNMSDDKFEQIDLNALQPEVLEELKETFNDWQKDLSPPLWPRIMDHIFIIDGKTYKFPA